MLNTWKCISMLESDIKQNEICNLDGLFMCCITGDPDRGPLYDYHVNSSSGC